MGYCLQACFWLKDKGSLIKAKGKRGDRGLGRTGERKGELCATELTVGWERGCRITCIYAAYPFFWYNFLNLFIFYWNTVGLPCCVYFWCAENLMKPFAWWGYFVSTLQTNNFFEGYYPLEQVLLYICMYLGVCMDRHISRDIATFCFVEEESW